MTIAREELDGLAARLEGAGPAEILAEAAARFPSRIRLASSFGPESCHTTLPSERKRLKAAERLGIYPEPPPATTGPTAQD